VKALVERNKFGMFGYNWIGGNYPKNIGLQFFENNNIFQRGQYFWDPNYEPNFRSYGDNVSVLSGGLDLSQPYIFNNINYGVLPGMQEKYFLGTNPSLGAIQFKKLP
jgi:hypothetical protein